MNAPMKRKLLALSKEHWSVILVTLITVANVGYWNWQGNKLETVMRTTELRKAQGEIYQRVIDLSSQYMDSADAYMKARDDLTRLKMVALDTKLGLAKSDFLVLEIQLAKLEGREPRAIQLGFVVPSTPTGLRLVP